MRMNFISRFVRQLSCWPTSTSWLPSCTRGWYSAAAPTAYDEVITRAAQAPAAA